MLALHGGWGASKWPWLSKIPLMCTLGVFLVSLEGVNTFHLLWKTLERHQDEDRNQSPVLDNFEFLLKSMHFCPHVHSLHIIFIPIFSLILNFTKWNVILNNTDIFFRLKSMFMWFDSWLVVLCAFLIKQIKWSNFQLIS